MQALHLLALLPVAETQADPNSHGFRPRRSTADALGQCYCALAKEDSPSGSSKGTFSLASIGRDLGVAGPLPCE